MEAHMIKPKYNFQAGGSGILVKKHFWRIFSAHALQISLFILLFCDKIRSLSSGVC